MRRGFLDLGSNLERVESLRRALVELGQEFQTGRTSSIYQSAPVGFAEQPDFWNLALEFYTDLEPDAIRVRLRALEDRLGRVRTANKYGPRCIDLDLTWLDGVSLPGRLPHPQVATQAFVLVPLCELIPDQIHPEFGRPLRQLLADLKPNPADLQCLGSPDELLRGPAGPLG